MSTVLTVKASISNRHHTIGRSTRIKLPRSNSCYHILLPQCVFSDCLAQSWPAPAITQALPVYSLVRRVLARIPPSPRALPCPHWPMLVSAQCLLAISSQTPQLVLDKRESPVSLTMHLPPFLPTAPRSLFSCPSYLPLVLEADHVASSFRLTWNP